MIDHLVMVSLLPLVQQTTKTHRSNRGFAGQPAGEYM